MLERIREIAGRVATSEGCELVDVELCGRGPGAVLRIYLDKGGGISHRDCEAVSRQVGTILDVEEVMPARYRLEVSSPGLDRRLVNLADYQRFAGQIVKFLLNSPQAGRRRLQGRLWGLEAGKVKLEIAAGDFLEIAPEEIEQANLVPDFGKKRGPKSQAERSNLR